MFSTQADFALDVVYFVNLFFVAPFAVLLALGFLAGAKICANKTFPLSFPGLHFVKNWAIIHATVMFYNMVIIDIYAYEALKLFDVLDLENVALGAFIIYGFFTIFPLVVLKRCDLPIAQFLSENLKFMLCQNFSTYRPFRAQGFVDLFLSFFLSEASRKNF